MSKKRARSSGDGDVLFKRSKQLECGQCGGILDSPVTIGCGHTFCRLCVMGRTKCVQCGATCKCRDHGVDLPRAL